MNVVETKTVRTEVTKRIELTGQDIRKMVKTVTGNDLPVRAEIYVMVPGGADWSNTELNINVETPVVITWTEVTEE